MSPASASATPEWARARLAAALLAVDPEGLGGAVVRAHPGPARDAWCAELKDLLGEPWRRLPLHVSLDRLLGGLELSATLRAGRPVMQAGLLSEVHGGVLVASMAERLTRGTVAHLSAALDEGVVRVERDGFGVVTDARFCLVALDEGEDDEAVAPALAERLALHLSLEAVPPRVAMAPRALPVDEILEARRRLGQVRVDASAVTALCAAALALGVSTMRAPAFALRVARAHAALFGRGAVAEEDLAVAGALVLGPRATRRPPTESEAEAEPPPPPPDSSADDEEGAPEPPDGPLEDVVLEAAQAALPAGLLDALAAGQRRARAKAEGGAGDLKADLRHGRPLASRPANGRPDGRIDVIATLRAAAPWQRLRKAGKAGKGPGVHVRGEDVHLRRYQRRARTTTIFAVDASGSAALARLAEAKGAVEQVLADCYVRRDQVALLGFRGDGAELLLAPTRSLTRAKRALGELPGGGTTPLASGISAAAELAHHVRGRGDTPVVVLLTDGRGNVSRDGARGRAAATQDALRAARALAELDVRSLFVDTAPRAQPQARALADAMRARYLHLPRADARHIAAAVEGL